MEWSGGCQTPCTRFLVEWRTKASNMRTISISLYMDIAEQSSHSFPDSNNNYYVIAKRGRAPPRHCHPPPDGIDFVLGIRYSLPAVGFLSTYRSLWTVEGLLALLVVLFNPMLVLELSFNRTYSLNPCLLWIGKSSALLRSILIGRLTCSVSVWWTYSQLNTQTAFTTGLGTGTLSRLRGCRFNYTGTIQLINNFLWKRSSREKVTAYSNETRFCAIRAGFVMDILGYVIGGYRFRSLECMIKVFTKNGDNFLSMRVYAKCIYEAFLVATQETHRRAGFI